MSHTKSMPAGDYLLFLLQECYWSKNPKCLKHYHDADASLIDQLVLCSDQRTLSLLDQLITLNNWKKISTFICSRESKDYFLIYFSCICLYSFKEHASAPLTVVPTSNTHKELFISVKEAYNKYLKQYVPNEFSLWWNLLDIELDLMASIS